MGTVVNRICHSRNGESQDAVPINGNISDFNKHICQRTGFLENRVTPDLREIPGPESVHQETNK